MTLVDLFFSLYVIHLNWQCTVSCISCSSILLSLIKLYFYNPIKVQVPAQKKSRNVNSDKFPKNQKQLHHNVVDYHPAETTVSAKASAKYIKRIVVLDQGITLHMRNSCSITSERNITNLFCWYWYDFSLLF